MPLSRFGTSVTPEVQRAVNSIIFNLGVDPQQVVLRDGSNPLTGDWNVGGKKISNIGLASQPNDVRKSTVDSVESIANSALSSANSKLSLSGGTLTGDLAMSDNKITGLSAGTSNGDSVRYEELQTVSTTANNAQTSADNDTNANTRVSKSGDTLTGDLAMSDNKITGLSAGTSNGDSVRYEELQTVSTTASNAQTSADNANTNANTRVSKSGDTMTGSLAMSDNKITGLSAGTSNGDSVRYEELQTVSTTASNAQTSADSANTNANTRVLKSGDTMTGNLIYQVIKSRDCLKQQQTVNVLNSVNFRQP